MMEAIFENPDGTQRRAAFEEERPDPLFNPEIFRVITEEEIPKKVVGELGTIKAIFLCSCGRLVLNAKKTSYNLMINDESGAGKDWVTDKTLEIWKDCSFDYHRLKRKKGGEEPVEIPQKSPITIKRTRISEKVLNYWHNPEFEPDWTWDGKVLYCEDISNSVLNCDVFKVMASSGSCATILIDQFVVDIEINGKPVMMITTASANPNPENIRRFSIVNLDTNIDQTKEIMKRQAWATSVGRSLEYDSDVTKSLGGLGFVKVKVPYAERLVDIFPCGNIIMRTFFERFLDYIKASAALHQKQRSFDSEGYVIATEADYEIAREVMMKMSSNRMMVPMTRNHRKLLKVVEDMGSGFHKVKEIEGSVTFLNKNNLYDNLDMLAEKGLLRKERIVITDEGGREKEYIAYSPCSDLDGFQLPTFENIGHYPLLSLECVSHLSQNTKPSLSQYMDNEKIMDIMQVRDNRDNGSSPLSDKKS